MEKKNERPVDRIRQLSKFYISHKVFRGENTFESACGLSYRYVKNLCLTKHGNPGVDTIVKIYRTFRGVSLEWLVLGEGEMFTVSEEEALRAARDATDVLKKEKSIRSVLNSRQLKGMTYEEKMELVWRVLGDEK